MYIQADIHIIQCTLIFIAVFLLHFIIARKLYVIGQFHCDRHAFRKTISALDSQIKQKLLNNVLADKKLDPDYMLVQLVLIFAKQGRRQGLTNSRDGCTKKRKKFIVGKFKCQTL